MIKNTAGQFVAFQLLDASDGSNVTTGSPTVYVTINGGTQTSGAGAVAHEGNGQWSYAASQADTNGDHVAFTIVLSGAISQTVNLYPKDSPPTLLQIQTKQDEILADLAAIDTQLSTIDTTADSILSQLPVIPVPAITRDVSDILPIYFSWPTETPTPTITVSIDGAAFGNVAGAVTRKAIYDLPGEFGFQLAYNANDRPAGAGTAVYRITDGLVTDDLVLIVKADVAAITVPIYTITVTVEDGDGDGISGARVGVAGATISDVTDTMGIAVIPVSGNGTYSIVTIPPGSYEVPSPASVVVSGANQTVTIVLTQSSVTVPDDPTLATLIVRCIDESGAAEEGVTIEAQMVAVPSGSTGYAFDALKGTADSNGSGDALLTVVRLATYRIRRGTSNNWTKIVIPNQGSVTVTSFIGID